MRIAHPSRPLSQILPDSKSVTAVIRRAASTQAIFSLGPLPTTTQTATAKDVKRAAIVRDYESILNARRAANEMEARSWMRPASSTFASASHPGSYRKH